MVKQIDDLVFSNDSSGVLGEGLKVEETPHYRYALGYLGKDDKLKFDYLQWHRKRKKDLTIKVVKFNKLIESIRIKGVKNRIETRGNQIADGHHRAAAALACGYKEIRCRVLS